MRVMDLKIEEHDVVAFKKPVGKWPAGTTGAVVGEGKDYMLVEIVNMSEGDMLDLLDVPVEDLELVVKWS